MEREHRYYVAKKKDVEKYLSDEQQTTLHMLMTKINVGRLRDDKPVLQTVCVDSDWPEYEIVWKMIEARVDGKASPARVQEGYVLVPVEPTQEMVDAGCKALGALYGQHGASEAYKAMLAAAPTPPVSEDRKDAQIERLEHLTTAIDDRCGKTIEKQSAALKLAREALFDMQDSYAAVHGWKDSFVIAATTAIAAIDALGEVK